MNRLGIFSHHGQSRVKVSQTPWREGATACHKLDECLRERGKEREREGGGERERERESTCVSLCVCVSKNRSRNKIRKVVECSCVCILQIVYGRFSMPCAHSTLHKQASML